MKKKPFNCLFILSSEKQNFVNQNINDSYSFIVPDDISILIIVHVFLSKAPRVLQNSQRDNILVDLALQTIKRPSKRDVSQHDTASYPEIPHNDTGKNTDCSTLKMALCVHACNVNNEMF